MDKDQWTVLGHYEPEGQRWAVCVSADNQWDAENNGRAQIMGDNGWVVSDESGTHPGEGMTEEDYIERYDQTVADVVISGKWIVGDDPDVMQAQTLSPEPRLASDNVAYFPILGGWEAQRVSGFVVKDGEAILQIFDTEREADELASEIAGTPGHEEISVEPVKAGKEFIYLNPSLETDDGVPNVFIYQGANGEPEWDEPIHHYVMFDHHCSECGLAREDGHMPGCSKGAM